MTQAGSCHTFRSNDPQFLEQLVYLYSDALVRYAYCYVGSSAAAEDVMEEAFVVFLLKKRMFLSMEQARTWLYKTVRSKAVDYLRRHKREVPLEDVENVLSGGDMESVFLTKERNAAVYTCMQKLPEQYRAVLQLSYFDEFTVSQICEILNRTPKQVYNLLERAKTTLKALLIQEGIFQ